MTDPNLNRLWSFDFFGSNYRYTSLAEGSFGGSSVIMWPSALVSRIGEDGYVEIFVSEYVGRVWRISIELESLSRNQIIYSDTSTSSSGTSSKGLLSKR